MALNGGIVVLDVLLLQRDVVGVDTALERVQPICELLDVSGGGEVSLRDCRLRASHTLCLDLSLTGPY